VGSWQDRNDIITTSPIMLHQFATRIDIKFIATLKQHQIWDVIMFVTRGTIIEKVVITTLENDLQLKKHVCNNSSKLDTLEIIWKRHLNEHQNE
jgi:hypothetical protein